MASNSYEDTLKEKLSDLQESLQILSEARTKNTPAEELLAMIYDVSRCHFEVAEILSSNHNELEAVSHLISAMYYIKATLNPRSAGLLFRQLSDALAPEPARAFIYEQKHGKYLIAGRTFNTLGEAITHARSACPEWRK